MNDLSHDRSVSIHSLPVKVGQSFLSSSSPGESRSKWASLLTKVLEKIIVPFACSSYFLTLKVSQVHPQLAERTNGSVVQNWYNHIHQGYISSHHLCLLSLVHCLHLAPVSPYEHCVRDLLSQSTLVSPPPGCLHIHSPVNGPDLVLHILMIFVPLVQHLQIVSCWYFLSHN